MYFDDWWEKLTNECKKDLLFYYGLTKKKLAFFCERAGFPMFSDLIPEDMELHIKNYSNEKEPSTRRAIFRYQRPDGKILFEKDLGVVGYMSTDLQKENVFLIKFESDPYEPEGVLSVHKTYEGAHEKLEYRQQLNKEMKQQLMKELNCEEGEIYIYSDIDDPKRKAICTEYDDAWVDIMSLEG